MSSFQRSFVALGAALLFLASAAPSHAFDFFKDNKNRTLRWKTQVVTIHVNPNGVPGIKATDVLKVFQNAAKNWNSIKCAKMTVFIRQGTAYPKQDKINSISFPPNFSGAGYSQSNFVMDQNANFTDFDVALNPKSQWSLNPVGGGLDLESAAMMAVGTILGLASSSVQTATMYGRMTSGDISKRTLDPDDIKGLCTLYPSGQPTCATDADCPTGLSCKAAQCAAVAPKANANSCKPCTATADCKSSDLVCDLVGNGRFCIHLCTPDGLCPAGFSCSGAGVDAQCLPNTGICKATCSTDADCGNNYKCKNGQCAPECTTDQDCGSGKTCSSGRCIAKGTCTTDLDCPPLHVCKSGACVKDSTTQPCTNDNDCPNGYDCVNGNCTATGSCTDGTTQACKCPNGNASTQTCKGGAWGACENCGGTPTTCTPNATQACKCSDGKAGTQTCSADGKAWGACTGCGGGGNKVCAPGSTQACVCTDGKNGAQTCSADGMKWEECKCSGGGGNLCTAGSSQACVCSDGKSGTQSCAADGKSWEACTGCGGGGNACTPGATQACVCSDGKSGSQSCNQDGQSWGQCTCSGNPPAPTDGGNGGADKPAANIPCTTHNDCPTGNFCVQNVCRPSGNNGGGCGCSSNNGNQTIPFLFFGLLFFAFVLRIRRA
jgi:hypothetical protein